MKLKNLPSLGLGCKTLDDIEIDHVATISTDEFHKPMNTTDSLNYRESAINRIIGLKLPLYNNCNLTYNIAKRFVKVVCPYCEVEMNVVNGGGNGSTSNVEYRCGCGANANITLDNNAALCFTPKEK
jgi:hypothetical protein